MTYRPRGRNDRGGPRQGHADNALCLLEPRRGRWRKPAPTSSSAIWLDHRRRDRRQTALKIRDCPSSSMNGRRRRWRSNPRLSSWLMAARSPSPRTPNSSCAAPAILCHGFYGASSMERLPTERAMTEQVSADSRRSGESERERNCQAGFSTIGCAPAAPSSWRRPLPKATGLEGCSRARRNAPPGASFEALASQRAPRGRGGGWRSLRPQSRVPLRLTPKA